MQFVLVNNTLKWNDAWFLLHGALNTVAVTALAGVIGTALGVLLGWLRFAHPLARIGTTPGIDVVRSVPLVVQLILLSSFLALAGHPANPFWLGTLILSASMAATTSEVVRGGLASVLPGYKRAARSLGMSYLQELRHISAPLALRVGLAGWVGLLISLVKDSSLIGVVGYLEFLRSTQVLITRTNKTLWLLALVGLFYFGICYPLSRYCRRIERKVAA
jgi:hydroxyproline transport system permease protein